MNHRLKGFLTVTVLAALFQLAAAGTAFAHHANVEITGIICNGEDYVVSYRAYSWSTNGTEGENDNIEIRVNGVYLETGVFSVANGYDFTGQFLAPESALVVVRATPLGTWGNGTAADGSFAEDSENVPAEPCGEREGTGRFTGGGRQVDVGVATVTRGLTIHCDLLLSNNLEINWGVSQHFHMTEHTQTIKCFDNPAIDQKPPAAPLDTLEGIGTGRYNGQTGYSIRFTLVDAGEPGRNDQMWFKIYQTANPANVVLEVPVGSYLTNGNLQAHYDQPHKK